MNHDQPFFRPRLWALFAFMFLGVVVGTIRGATDAGQDLEPRLALLEQTIQRGSSINPGDNAWMLASAGLVLMMTAPGLILFYGGLVRRKNVLATMMHSMILMAMVSMVWLVFGYSLAFGKGNLFLGDPRQFFLLRGVGGEPNPDYAATVPHLSFMVFQLMFAIITPAIISGALAERMKFKAFVLFMLLWIPFVYCPLTHMVWGPGGFLNWAGGGAIPVLDFAGGLVVHINAGVAALVCALVLGKRKGYPDEPMPPHNVVLSLIGTGLLWVGWFGFTGGSALGAGDVAARAVVATHFSAAAGALGWAAMEWLLRGKPSVLGTASGMVAGLAAITPAAGFIAIQVAPLIGGAGGVVCYLAVTKLKRALQYDDALDVFGVHAAGSAVGMICLGLFATATVNSPAASTVILGADHLPPTGGIAQLYIQLKGLLFTVVFVALATFILLQIVKIFGPLRVSEEDEVSGLDLTQHDESAYND